MLPQLPRYCSSCLILPLTISLFFSVSFSYFVSTVVSPPSPFVSLSLSVSRLLLQIYITPSFVSDCERMSSHLPSAAWVLKLYSNYYSLLIRLWGREVKRREKQKGRVGRGWITRMCFLLQLFIIVKDTGLFRRNYHKLCVCRLTLNVQLRRVFARHVWVLVCVGVLLCAHVGP